MNHFFAYLSRMKFIRRWGLMRNTQPENIQEHTARVAMIAHALAVQGFTLVLAARRTEQAEELIAQLPGTTEQTISARVRTW